MVCLRLTNTESMEREFSQIKHIGLKATNRRPENVFYLVCRLKKTGTNSTMTNLKKKTTIVANKVPPYNGTTISKEFLKPCIASWLAHLRRITLYLAHGEGVWWKEAQSFLTQTVTMKHSHKDHHYTTL